MRISRVATLFLGGVLAAVVAVPSFAAPQDRQRGEEHQNREYHFRSADKAKLQKSYPDRSHVDWNHREHFVRGGHLPADWHDRIRPVPEAVIRELPPIPAGCEVGYLDGWAVVYDPTTGEIIETLDLQ